MAFDTVVDSTKLFAGMTATANAIRKKTGSTDPIEWDASNGFKSAVEGIEAGGGGEEVYYTPAGRCYVEHMRITGMKENKSVGAVSDLYSEAVNLKSVITMGGNISATSTKTFSNCSALETAILNNITAYGHYVFESCTSLKSVQLGSVGFPVTAMSSPYIFRLDTQAFEVTIYVDASALADIPTEVTKNSPWGATNATIIYRNSTTGEVITE